jgi:hypothetical protein
MTEPEMQWVESSNVEAIGYDSDSAELYVRYLNQPLTYVYTDVPQSTFDDLMGAPSKGSYLNREIKPSFQFRTQ